MPAQIGAIRSWAWGSRFGWYCLLETYAVNQGFGFAVNLLRARLMPEQGKLWDYYRESGTVFWLVFGISSGSPPYGALANTNGGGGVLLPNPHWTNYLLPQPSVKNYFPPFITFFIPLIHTYFRDPRVDLIQSIAWWTLHVPSIHL